MHFGQTSETALNIWRNLPFFGAFIQTKGASSETTRKMDADPVFYDFELLTSPLTDGPTPFFKDTAQRLEMDDGKNKA
jgi:hypothetical protein